MTSSIETTSLIFAKFVRNMCYSQHIRTRNYLNTFLKITTCTVTKFPINFISVYYKRTSRLLRKKYISTAGQTRCAETNKNRIQLFIQLRIQNKVLINDACTSLFSLS